MYFDFKINRFLKKIPKNKINMNDLRGKIFVSSERRKGDFTAEIRNEYMEKTIMYIIFRFVFNIFS